MDPRPVEGVREYALALRLPGQAPDKLLEDVVLRMTNAGLEVVERGEPHARLRLDTSTWSAWAVEVRTSSDADAATLQLRARPPNLNYNNFWPPDELVDVVAQFVEDHRPLRGRTPMDASAHWLTMATAPAWLGDVLFSPRREVPVVVITPGPYAVREAATGAARELAGLAIVYVFDDEDALLPLRRAVSKERGVYGGAVRLYRPGFTPESDPLDHDLLVRHYLEVRLTGGRTLGAEIARRILPLAGGPIATGRDATTPVAAAVATRPVQPAPRSAPPAPTPTASVHAVVDAAIEALRRRIAAVEADGSALAEENRRLTVHLTKLQQRFDALDATALRQPPGETHVDGLPWPLTNPEGTLVEVSDAFARDAAKIARDGSLAAEVRKKMEAALLAPQTYGKEMRGVRKGQRACYVANNYRLVWVVEGESVKFVLIVSKEDPEYSPRGA